MLGLKTLLKNKIIYKNIYKFPSVGISTLIINHRLDYLENELSNIKKNLRSRGGLLTYPLIEAIKVYRKILPFNPNNLGNWSLNDIDKTKLYGSRTFERELVFQMIDLYHGNKSEFEGYVTSGATEGNIFSAWMGRNYLFGKGIKTDRIALIKTKLSHYSLEKAADIINVKSFLVPIDEKWSMNADKLIESMESLIKKGYKGFLLPLTLGYTLTGTSDNCEEICKRIDFLKNKHKVNVFIWMDAALNGLIEPFLNKRFRPLKEPQIMTFTCDFHKFGFTPYQSGIILYRKKLRRFIEKPIDYLEEKDSTLLGSRSGVCAVSAWAVINKLGFRGFKNIIKKRQEKLKSFLKECKKNKDLQIIWTKNSLSCGVILKRKDKGISKLLKEYGLEDKSITINVAGEEKNFSVANAFFLN